MQQNNIRNKYRQYAARYCAYDWAPMSFRYWAVANGYSATYSKLKSGTIRPPRREINAFRNKKRK